METKTKWFIGIGLAGLAIGGGIIYYRKRNTPKLTTWNNMTKEFTYSLAGKQRTLKINSTGGVAIGNYRIVPIIDKPTNQIVGVNVKRGNKIIDSMQSAPIDKDVRGATKAEFDELVKLANSAGTDIFQGLTPEQLNKYRNNFVNNVSYKGYVNLSNVIKKGEKNWSDGDKMAFNYVFNMIRG